MYQRNHRTEDNFESLLSQFFQGKKASFSCVFCNLIQFFPHPDLSLKTCGYFQVVRSAIIFEQSCSFLLMMKKKCPSLSTWKHPGIQLQMTCAFFTCLSDQGNDSTFVFQIFYCSCIILSMFSVFVLLVFKSLFQLCQVCRSS